MNKIVVMVIMVLATSCYYAPEVKGQFTQAEFDEMATEMAKGNVKDISTKELKAMPEVILLDARERKEYEISHIPGAIWVGYDDFDLSRVSQLDKKKEVVVYCSVGYRSEKVGEKLQKAGFSHVNNLKGSLFQWSNEGNELVNGKGEKTKKVHGYNAKWAKWVLSKDVVY